MQLPEYLHGVVDGSYGINLKLDDGNLLTRQNLSRVEIMSYFLQVVFSESTWFCVRIDDQCFKTRTVN